MRKTITFFALLAAMTCAPAVASQAQEVGGAACATPGTVMLSGIPTKRSELVPSVGREISGYGRQAQVSNCLIELVCVATDSSDAARDIASKQCVVVRDQLVRSDFKKDNIDTSRKNPGNGRVAGMVYFTVK